MNKIPEHDFTLSVNIPVTSTEGLRDVLACLRKVPLAEVWLAHKSAAESIATYKNADRAFVMFLGANSDEVLHAIDSSYVGAPDRTLPIYMVNGQGDEQPISQTVLVDDAYAAIIHFYEHSGPTTQVTWSSD